MHVIMYKYKHFLDTFSATVCLPRSCQASEKTNYFIEINFFVEKIFYQNYSSSRKNNFFLKYHYSRCYGGWCTAWVGQKYN